ncbi:MAG TPA: hypothetical protein VMW94_09275 [Actinomycetes bacterium]|nr:hypothetical protein [Actinomycetes bacterium]
MIRAKLTIEIVYDDGTEFDADEVEETIEDCLPDLFADYTFKIEDLHRASLTHKLEVRFEPPTQEKLDL